MKMLVCLPSFNLALFLKLLQSADGAQGRQVAQSNGWSVAQSTKGSSEREIIHHFSPLLDQPGTHQETLSKWYSLNTGAFKAKYYAEFTLQCF